MDSGYRWRWGALGRHVISFTSGSEVKDVTEGETGLVCNILNCHFKGTATWRYQGYFALG